MYKVIVYDNRATYPTTDDFGKYLNDHTFKYLEGAIRKFTDYIIDYKAKETKFLYLNKKYSYPSRAYTTIDVTLTDGGCIIDSRTFTIQL